MPIFYDYLSGLGAFELIGVGGFLVYIFAFGGVQLQLLDGNSSAYCLANIAAAIMVSASLVAEFNLATALIQGSWIAIGLTGLILRARAARRVDQQRPSTNFEAGAM